MGLHDCDVRKKSPKERDTYELSEGPNKGTAEPAIAKFCSAKPNRDYPPKSDIRPLLRSRLV